MARRLAFSFVCGLGLIGVGACGTLTGLSDDYTFDLAVQPGVEGGSADGSTASDGSSPPDASFDAGMCTATQAESTNNYLSGASGSSDCKSCLQTSCCVPVAQCVTGSGNCKNRLDCNLKCTEQGGNARQTCLNQCQATVPTGSAAYVDVTRCQCQSRCGF